MTDETEIEQDGEPLSRDDLDIMVSMNEEDLSVNVEFTGFDSTEEAEEYAEFLASTLPLLLFESTRIQ
jgi:hypothetical protein